MAELEICNKNKSSFATCFNAFSSLLIDKSKLHSHHVTLPNTPEENRHVFRLEQNQNASYSLIEQITEANKTPDSKIEKIAEENKTSDSKIEQIAEANKTSVSEIEQLPEVAPEYKRCKGAHEMLNAESTQLAIISHTLLMVMQEKELSMTLTPQTKISQNAQLNLLIIVGSKQQMTASNSKSTWKLQEHQCELKIVWKTLKTCRARICNACLS